MRCVRCENHSEKGDLFCRKCGEELPQESTFQCECGAEVCDDDRYCHQCGSMFSSGTCDCGCEVPPNANYCPGCGVKIEKQEEPETGYSEPEEAPAEEPPKEDTVDLGLLDISKGY